jgi:hypothetical protein
VRHEDAASNRLEVFLEASREKKPPRISEGRTVPKSGTDPKNSLAAT